VPTTLHPLVSAIIPAYNCQEYVGAAIESVLDQTYSRIECVVVDDGSTDATASIIAGYGADVVLIEKENGGVSGARNLGAEHSSGEYYAFLDADDVWLPDKIRVQMTHATADRELGLIYSSYWAVNQDLTDHRFVGIPDAETALHRIVTLQPPGVHLALTGLVSAHAFSKTGGFDERLTTSADLDLAIRLLGVTKAIGVDEPLALYRTHASQMSLDLKRMQHDMRIVFEKVFENDPAIPELARLRGRSEAQLALILGINLIRQGRTLEGLSRVVASVLLNPSALASMVLRRLERS